VEERQILHRDCSLNNAMILDELGSSEGFLIDWEFAVRIAADNKYPIGGTVSTPHSLNIQFINSFARAQSLSCHVGYSTRSQSCSNRRTRN
jgi:hypothetical protein